MTKETKLLIFFCVTQQSNSDLGRLNVEVSRLHSITHTHTQTHTHTHTQSTARLNERSARHSGRSIHKKHNGQTLMPSVGFEPAIPEIELPQNLDRTATGIGSLLHCEWKLRYKVMSLCLQRYFSTVEHKAASSGSKYTTAAEKLIQSSLSCFENRTLTALGTTHTVNREACRNYARTYTPDRQCTYNLTLRCVRVTTVAVEKQ